MSLRGSDMQGQLVLRKLAKRERAKAILREAITPGQASLSTLGLALVGGVATYFLEKNSSSRLLESVVVGIVVAIAGMAAEQWRIARRLDAAIEFLNLDDSDAQ